MKKLFNLTLAALLSLCASDALAQKFGQVNFEELIQLMPEMDSVNAKYQAATQDYSEQLESIQVELNNKVYDYQKNAANLSDAVKQLREKEIQDLRQRQQDFYQIAQQELAKVENDLMAPLIEKATEAIKKYCKANGIVGVYQTGAMIYLDETAVPDITAKIKPELGIKPDAKLPAPQQ